MPDFTNLTIVQVVSLCLVVAAIDIIGSIALSITQQKFSLGAVAIWIQSHVLARVFPILALAALGHGLTLGGTEFLPAIPFCFAAALAGLGAYVLETIASIRDSFQDASRPTDETPQA
jgi:hypothetical protein